MAGGGATGPLTLTLTPTLTSTSTPTLPLALTLPLAPALTRTLTLTAWQAGLQDLYEQASYLVEALPQQALPPAEAEAVAEAGAEVSNSSS